MRAAGLPLMPPTDPPGTAVAPDGRMTLSLLFAEAERQLDVCNACRYCEGLCAVFPALARGPELDADRISQLANLCHDCRACFDACMYATPHAFAVNVPAALGAIRAEDYRRYLWPSQVPRLFRGRVGLIAGNALAAVVVLVAALINVGPAGLIAGHEGAAGPYELLPYPVILVLLLLPSLFALAVFGLAARTYLRVSRLSLRAVRLPALTGAVWSAASLRYLRGGGADCYYPRDDQPSPSRRLLHGAVAYGFGLCAVSTIAAGIMQDIIGSQPPYPVVSVPVMSGVVGGVSLLVGCVGLFLLKLSSSEVTSVAEMTIKDYGLIAGLAFLSATGLLTLLLRDTPAFGLVFLVHLSAVIAAFALAPYSKFAHVLFRFLALLQDTMERAH